MVLTSGIIAWVVIVSGGAWGLAKYAQTAGTPANAHQILPAENQITRVISLPTLVMSLHPQCPCSRASVNELEVLVARCRGQMTVNVLIVDYPGIKTDITQSELWQSASRIPGAVCIRDERGTISDAFHAETSGQVFLYDTDGSLRFNGGITDARGHAGDNEGLLAVEAVLHNTTPTTRATPVYGCTLR